MNPLLQNTVLPPFNQIEAAHMEAAITQLIERNKTQLTQLLAQSQYSWANLIAPFEEQEDELHKAWSPISHLHSVADNEERRNAYNVCVAKLTEYETQLGQNKALFDAYVDIKQSADFETLNTAQKKVVEYALRDFHLSGIDLPADKQKRFADIQKRLSELSTTFAEHVMDATDAWNKLITDVNELAGLPDNALALAKQAANNKNQTGYLLTLDFPCYYAVINFADNQTLREEIYTAYVTRASDQGPHAGQFDNSLLMDEIVALRQEEAKLLGFDNFAQLSLATKMAKSTDEVIHFLEALANKSMPMAKQEFIQLEEFARQQYGISHLKSWDVGYYSEKLQQHLYHFSQEELRPYFPIDTVLKGLFTVVKRLFAVEFKEITNFESWHDDARLFELKRDDQLIGRVFIDLYARPQKQGGAWMGDCRIRRRLSNGDLQLPVAYVVANFARGCEGKPALLTHDDVITLFHEFGHALHLLLTRIDVAAVSGINGVAWDAVELPSQFLENWCWQEETLLFLSSHYETGEPLPKSMLANMLAAKNFQAGLHMMRQLEFSLFDFKLHQIFEAGKTNIQAMLDDLRQQTAVLVTPTFNRFQHSFKHIFAGGYAAGYYSYKWAEVLSADAFSAFEEEGIFNPATGKRFEDCILARGGSQNAMDLFKAFRGREPEIQALLRHTGIAQKV
jgi:oligopeptidase A